jgi:hypothetical protein
METLLTHALVDGMALSTIAPKRAMELFFRVTTSIGIGICFGSKKLNNVDFKNVMH